MRLLVYCRLVAGIVDDDVLFLLSFSFFFGSDTIFKEQLEYNLYMFREKLQNIDCKVESAAVKSAA